MIRGKITDRAFLFGLSQENLRRLGENQAIRFNLTTCGGPDIEIFIMAGETEAAIFEQLKELGVINQETTIIGEPRS